MEPLVKDRKERGDLWPEPQPKTEEIIDLEKARGELKPTPEQIRFLEGSRLPIAYLWNLFFFEKKKLVVLGNAHGEPHHVVLFAAFLDSLCSDKRALTVNRAVGVDAFLEESPQSQEIIEAYIRGGSYPPHLLDALSLTREGLIKRGLLVGLRRLYAEYGKRDLSLNIHCIDVPHASKMYEELVVAHSLGDPSLWAEREAQMATNIAKIMEKNPDRIGVSLIGNKHACCGWEWAGGELMGTELVGQYLQKKLGKNRVALIQQVGENTLYQTLGDTNIFIEAAIQAKMKSSKGFPIAESPFAHSHALHYIWQYPNEPELMRLTRGRGLDLEKVRFRRGPKYCKLFDGVILHGEIIRRVLGGTANEY